MALLIATILVGSAYIEIRKENIRNPFSRSTSVQSIPSYQSPIDTTNMPTEPYYFPGR